jgi:hypothetical protein
VKKSPSYLASRLRRADLVRRSTFLPSEQVMRSRDEEKGNFLPGEQVMRSRYGELPTWRADYDLQLW